MERGGGELDAGIWVNDIWELHCILRVGASMEIPRRFDELLHRSMAKEFWCPIKFIVFSDVFAILVNRGVKRFSISRLPLTGYPNLPTSFSDWDFNMTGLTFARS
jgi:hypothetical protein